MDDLDKLIEQYKGLVQEPAQDKTAAIQAARQEAEKLQLGKDLMDIGAQANKFFGGPGINIAGERIGRQQEQIMQDALSPIKSREESIARQKEGIKNLLDVYGKRRQLGQQDTNFDLQRQRIGLEREKMKQALDIAKMRDALERFKVGQKGKDKKDPIQMKLDEEFAKVVSKNLIKGTEADTDKQLEQLKDVSKKLKSGKELTGYMTGRTPDFLNEMFNPDAIAVRDEVQEVVQRSLRETLGAQFTEREGEMLLARAFNPNLDEKENAKRIDRLVNQIKTVADERRKAINYFLKNKTLDGFSGKYFNAGTDPINLNHLSADDIITKDGQVPGDRSPQSVDSQKTTFPMQVRKDGKVATVSNEQELEEARSEGWQ